MKYLVILGDGMADEPQAALNGQTPLEAAKTPTLDALAVRSEVGLLKTIPEGMSPGSDTANLLQSAPVLHGALSAGGAEHRRADEGYRRGHALQYRDADRGGAV